MLLRLCVAIIAVLALTFQGCVAIQTFPTAARSGDTITLAVGSPDGMTKTNTTVQFVSGSYSTNLPIRSIIRLRPDNTSHAAAYDGAVSLLSSIDSHGPWLTVMVLDLPVDLPVGNATINVSTSAVYLSVASVNDIPIGIEILPGTGTPNTFTYDAGNGEPGDVFDGNFKKLEPGPQVVIRSPQNSSTFAAAEIKVRLQVQNKNTLEIIPNPLPGQVKLTMDDMTNQNIASQLQMSWTRIGDDYTINLMAPSGSAAVYQTRFSVFSSGLSVFRFVSEPAPIITSVNFYDVNGNLLTVGMPSITDYTVTVE